MATDRRLAHGVLALTGSLTSHAIAYAIVPGGAGISGHSATESVFAALFSALLALCGLTVVRSAVAKGSVVSIGVGRLACASAGLFLAQEITEGLGSGASITVTLTASSLLVGLAVQPIVALALLLLVRRSERLGRVLAKSTGFGRAPHANLLRWRPTPSVASGEFLLVRTGGSRAPPR